jgi:hypothetical protein
MKFFILILVAIMVAAGLNELEIKALQEMGLGVEGTMTKEQLLIYLDKYVKALSANEDNYKFIPNLYNKVIKDIPEEEILISDLPKYLSIRKITDYMTEVYLEDMEKVNNPRSDL